MKVSVFISCSNEYLKYAELTVASILASREPETKLHFFIYCLGLDISQQQNFEEIFSKLPDGCEMTLLEINAQLKRLGFGFTVNAGRETACHLLAAELLPQEDRVIALDCDLIVRHDLAFLFELPMGENLIAGVLDFDFIAQYHCGNRKYIDYYSKRLNMKTPYQYLQGGVLLMNLAQFRAEYKPGQLFEQFCRERFLYDEQDFLNLLCQGKKIAVDPRWNVLHDNDRYRMRYVIELGPEQFVSAYKASRAEPWIIHYAGNDKPWVNPYCDFADIFWHTVEDSGVDIAFPLIAPKRRFYGIYWALKLLRNEFRRFYCLHFRGKR